MASSFVTFREYGFWAPDAMVEAFQLLLIESIAALPAENKPEWLLAYQTELAWQSLPLISGGMSMCFDETLIDPEKLATVCTLVENIAAELQNNPELVSAAHLNHLMYISRKLLVDRQLLNWDEKKLREEASSWMYMDEPLPENFKIGFKLLLQLLKGRLHYKADSIITYWHE